MHRYASPWGAAKAVHPRAMNAEAIALKMIRRGELVEIDITHSVARPWAVPTDSDWYAMELDGTAHGPWPTKREAVAWISLKGITPRLKKLSVGMYDETETGAWRIVRRDAALAAGWKPVPVGGRR